MANSLRERLRAVPSADAPARSAWREVIRALRARRRRTGIAGGLASQDAVDRALSAEVTGADEAVAEVKALLGRVTREPEAREALAVAIDALVASLVPRIVERPVALVLDGWPDWMDPDSRRALLGADSCAVEPRAAAAIVRDLDGLDVGGSVLGVGVRLPPGAALPSPPRRSDLRRGRPSPWVRVDEEGRWSLTPRLIADRQARWLVRELGCRAVVDAFCGCGGNAVAFALAGASVVAVERDPRRAALARENARALGARVRVLTGGTGATEAALQADPGAALFLDPPWGGPDWDRGGIGWADLVPAEFARLSAPVVMLKAPRTFRVATLPPGRVWEVRAEVGEGRVVKMLTCVGVEARSERG